MVVIEAVGLGYVLDKLPGVLGEVFKLVPSGAVATDGVKVV